MQTQPAVHWKVTPEGVLHLNGWTSETGYKRPVTIQRILQMLGDLQSLINRKEPFHGTQIVAAWINPAIMANLWKAKVLTAEHFEHVEIIDVGDFIGFKTGYMLPGNIPLGIASEQVLRSQFCDFQLEGCLHPEIMEHTYQVLIRPRQ